MELKDEAPKYWKALAAERPDDAKLKALAAEYAVSYQRQPVIGFKLMAER